ncbi:MAG: metal ABC transporter substrate-binding protein [Actinobacteria bacterium]|nr:metal ABC transporter substrate-binding protein [Actinomycetota bacterium]
MKSMPPTLSCVWRIAGIFGAAALLAVATTSCGSGGSAPQASAGVKVVAITSYLADITQNVAGSRSKVTSLIPEGSDPHAFEATPRDARVLAGSRLVILDVKGLTPTIDDLIAGSAHAGQVVVEAASGLTAARDPNSGQTDPHFWLDPVNVITYVENIQKGLATVDPEGAQTFRTNAEIYISRLKDLDKWIAEQVSVIPGERRLLVTNHEEFGYFAARYGFKIVGSIFPNVSAEGSPSAQQLATLVQDIKATGAPAVFLEAGTNADLADEIARETGVKVVNGLLTHYLGKTGPTYVDMMRWDVGRIVGALR